MVVRSKGIGIKICEILKLDPARTQDITMVFKPGDIVTITAVILPSVDQVDAIYKVVPDQVVVNVINNQNQVSHVQ